MASKRRSNRAPKESVNVSLQVTEAKDGDPLETFAPISMERRNGRATTTGAWRKRPGHKLDHDFGKIEVGYGVIPYAGGLAMYADGSTYSITTKALLGRIKLSQRPRWATHDNTLLIATGSTMRAYTASSGLRGLDGNPPAAKYISILNGYAIASGHDRTEIRWSDPGNHDSWPALNSTTVEDTDESVREQRTVRNSVIFFKDRSFEVWQNTGGTAVFSRAVVGTRGTMASDSVVQVQEVLMWLGDDGDFYQMNGAAPEPITAVSMRRELNKLMVHDDCYGLHLRAENSVAWIFPSDGRCFIYDYLRQVWSEDNRWIAGGWELPPYGAYGEIGRKRYMLDRQATGHLYERRDDLYDDAGESIRVLRRFRVRLSPQGRQSRVSRAMFRVSRGSGDPNSLEPPEFMVRWRFDEGEWSHTHNLSIGFENGMNPYIPIHVLGVGREIEFEVAETDAVQWLVTDLNLTARELGR